MSNYELSADRVELPPPERAAPTPRPDAGLALALQRTAGNAAVARVLGRCPDGSDPDCGCRQEPAAPEDVAFEHALARAARRRIARLISPESGGLLALGASGPPVSALQTALNSAAPAADPALVIDGAFGPATRGAVIEFQGANALVPDGIVGPQTNTVLGAVAGPATVPPEPKQAEVPDFPGLGAAVGCHYEPGEKAASRDDPGDFIGPPVAAGTPLFSGTFAITGFEQGKADLKPRHPDFLREMASRFRLNTGTPTHRIVRVEGLSDCVDTFGNNVGLRLRRGQSGSKGLIVAGSALPENVGPGVAAQEGVRLSVNDEGPGGRFGRRMNRAAVFHFELVETPKEPGEEPGPGPHLQGCDHPSAQWSIQPLASASGHASPPFFVGADAAIFVFTSDATKCNHAAVFAGVSVGAGGGFEISVPASAQLMSTTPPFAEQPANGLNGRGELFVAGASVAGGPVGVGGGFGFITMRSGALAGQRIDVGGLTLSPALKKKVGAKGSANVSLGTGLLTVFNRD